MMLLSFTGDCNTTAVKAQIIQTFTFHTGIADGIEIHCGASSLVNRRKRSNSRQISLRFHASKTADMEKVKLDPTNELRILKDDVKTTVIPELFGDAHKRSWTVLNKGVKSMSSIRQDGDVKETCGKQGAAEASVFDIFTPKILQICGMIFTISNNIIIGFYIWANIFLLFIHIAECGPGTFKNVLTKKCEKCPTGTYQPEAGKTTCLYCPEGSIIQGGENKNFTSCKCMHFTVF